MYQASRKAYHSFSNPSISTAARNRANGRRPSSARQSFADISFGCLSANFSIEWNFSYEGSGSIPTTTSPTLGQSESSYSGPTCNSTVWSVKSTYHPLSGSMSE